MRQSLARCRVLQSNQRPVPVMMNSAAVQSRTGVLLWMRASSVRRERFGCIARGCVPPSKDRIDGQGVIPCTPPNAPPVDFEVADELSGDGRAPAAVPTPSVVLIPWTTCRTLSSGIVLRSSSYTFQRSSSIELEGLCERTDSEVIRKMVGQISSKRRSLSIIASLALSKSVL